MKPSALFEGRMVPWPDPSIEKLGGGWKSWAAVPEFIRIPWQLATLAEWMSSTGYRPEHLESIVAEQLRILMKVYKTTFKATLF